jgi:hypothetical protein
MSDINQTPVQIVNTDALNMARLFAAATGLDLEFHTVPETESARRAFAAIFHVLAGQAEQAIYDLG